MALLPILETPDPRLRTISTPVETIDDDLQQLIDDMFETMYDAPGIGLAALQVGVPKRLLVIDLQERSEEDTSELQSLMRISYAVFCLNKKNTNSQSHFRSNKPMT